MNSIRPLVTITILTLVAVFIYLNIKDGPHTEGDTTSAWNDTSGVPDLQSTTGSAELPGGSAPPLSAAPEWTSPSMSPAAATSDDVPAYSAGTATLQSTPWSPSSPQTAGAATVAAEQDAMGSEPSDLPGVPEIPELPALPPLQPSSTVNPGPALSRDIPVARYPDSLTEEDASADGAATGANPAPATAGSAPPLGAATQNADTSIYAAESPARMTPLSAGPAAASSPYAAAKPTIQAVLARGELPRAHLMLSQWYGDTSLPAEQQEEIKSLLAQLAGTVIYSREHRLLPAHTVQPGETLETIANTYQVPWQLLAKINGVPSVDGVQPGQQLKVVRGPFMAVVNPSRGELALMLDGRYAGEFSVSIPSSPVLGESTWSVEEKVLQPAMSSVTPTSTVYAPTTPTVDRTLVLRSEQAGATAQKLTLGNRSQPTLGPDAGASASIQVRPQDAEELFDILSVGSRVVIRR